MTSGSGPPFAPPGDPDLSVRLGVLPEPGEAARQVAQIDGQLPGQLEMTAGRVEAARADVGDAPREREAAIGDPAFGYRKVDLVLSEPQEDMGVGPQVTEQVHRVVPDPLPADVCGG